MLRERCGQQSGFPFAIEAVVHVLDRAAATSHDMRAKGVFAPRRADGCHQRERAIGRALNGFARQGPWDVNVLAFQHSEAVTLRT
jgi:hypothetical protein